MDMATEGRRAFLNLPSPADPVLSGERRGTPNEIALPFGCRFIKLLTSFIGPLSYFLV